MRIRRQAGRLSPLETELLVVAAAAERRGEPEFHGYVAAKQVPSRPARQSVYVALDRLARFGLLTRRWEEPDLALDRKVPRRLLYRITDAGRMGVYPAVAGARVMGRRPPGPFTPGRLPPPVNPRPVDPEPVSRSGRPEG